MRLLPRRVFAAASDLGAGLATRASDLGEASEQVSLAGPHSPVLPNHFTRATLTISSPVSQVHQTAYYPDFVRRDQIYECTVFSNGLEE